MTNDAPADGRDAGHLQPDPSSMLERLSIRGPVVGLYDAPDAAPFAPLTVPNPRACVFASMREWRQGVTLHLTRERHGCGAMHLLGVETRSREDLLRFLYEEEGLRADAGLMKDWLDHAPHYVPRHENLLIGPLRPGQYEYLRSVTFYVNADQLAVLAAGAGYYHRPGDISPVIAPFGSGCMQLAALFDDLEQPQALIGGLDHAARKYMEPWMIAFTVTRPMFACLCSWADDPHSSLHTEFLNGLIRARKGSLG
jgi:hypothetical protein